MMASPDILRRLTLLAIIAGCSSVAGEEEIDAPPAEFSVTSQVQAGEPMNVVSENLTLFLGDGTIIDIQLGHNTRKPGGTNRFQMSQQEAIFATIWDPKSGDFRLMDRASRQQAVVTANQLLEWCASIESRVDSLPSLAAAAARPQFVIERDKQEPSIMLKQDQIVYEVLLSASNSGNSLRFRNFADAFAKLNSMRPGALPPQARIAVNQAVWQENSVPHQVKCQLSPKNQPVIDQRSQHEYRWKLSDDDRRLVDEVTGWAGEFTEVGMHQLSR